MVQVVADSSDMTSKPTSFFTEFDVVIASRCSDRDALIKINDACRANNTLFFAGGVHGMFGYMFADLNQHLFVE